ncbi:unnamed protein product, partial [Ectocarpus sp. 12 AP-2014]
GQLEGQVDELRAALEDARRGTAAEEAATARARAEAEELQGKLDSRCVFSLLVALRRATRQGARRSRQLQVSAFPLWRLG